MPPAARGNHQAARSALECGSEAAALEPEPKAVADAAVALRRPRILVRRTPKTKTGAFCNSAPRCNPKAASSRRTPRCLRHNGFQRRFSYIAKSKPTAEILRSARDNSWPRLLFTPSKPFRKGGGRDATEHRNLGARIMHQL